MSPHLYFLDSFKEPENESGHFVSNMDTKQKEGE